MKNTIIALLLAGLSPVALAKDSGQKRPALSNCPAGLSKSQAAKAPIRESLLIDIDGTATRVDIVQLGPKSGACAVMKWPEVKAMSSEEYRAFVSFSDDELPPVSDYVSTKDLTRDGADFAIYQGECGNSQVPLGTAYFYAANLAITGLRSLSGAYCLFNGSVYFDVHSVVSHGGTSGFSGLKTVKPAPQARGFGVQVGQMISPDGQSALSAVVTAFDGRASGVMRQYTTTRAEFSAGAAYDGSLSLLYGGPAYLPFLTFSNPIGLFDIMFKQHWPVTPQPYYLYLPQFRRNQLSDQSVVSNWAATSAPSAPITIDYPANGSRWEETVWGPTAVWVRGTKNDVGLDWYRIYLDGQEWPSQSKLAVYLTRGWHRLAVARKDNPSVRHTVRFYQP